MTKKNKKRKTRVKIENENKTRLTISKVKKDYLVSILEKCLIPGNEAKNLIGSKCANKMCMPICSSACIVSSSKVMSISPRGLGY